MMGCGLPNHDAYGSPGRRPLHHGVINETVLWTLLSIW
jgi:hypothetical protein